MNIGRSFSFLFEDQDWLKKSLLGVLIAAVPIIDFAWWGYIAELLRAVMAGQDVPVPDWGNFGEKWVRGSIMVIASLIYSIPVLILACIGFTPFIGGLFSGGEISDQAALALTGVGGIVGCLILLYSLALSFFLPAAYIHYAKSYEFGALFEFGKIIKVATEDLGKYVTAWLVSLLAAVLVGLVVGIVAGLIGWIPCIGWIIAWLIVALSSVYLFFIYGHLFGQVAAGPNAVLPPSKELM